jgi:hypothetical protein
MFIALKLNTERRPSPWIFGNTARDATVINSLILHFHCATQQMLADDRKTATGSYGSIQLDISLERLLY